MPTCPEFDLTIRGGRVCNADGVQMADLGIVGGRIVAVAAALPAGREDVDAAGRWVLPGGIDSHTHIEQLSGMGRMCADDFYSGTVSAAFGGTTTILAFAAQHREDRIPDVIASYHAAAKAKAVIDYGFHLILTRPDEESLDVHLPEAVRAGITSLKVYMTYDRLKLDDAALLDVMAVAEREGALVMVHAENHDMIRWIAHRLLERGHTAPKFHGVAHDPLAEAEATHRAITLSRLIDVPVLIVHVAGRETVELIRHARMLGARVLAESCPQYLFLEASDADLQGLEGAKFCCSPPPRDKDSQEAVWAGLCDGSLSMYSSDHAPYRYDETGKLPRGDATTFKDMANGVPGIELRLPLLFSEGVIKGRMKVEQFVALAAANHADTYGMADRKGRIAVGMDADIAVWNPNRETTIRWNLLHDNVGYTPYEGMHITGWPEDVFCRGRSIVRAGELRAERGSGEYVARSRPNPPNLAPSNTSRAALSALVGLKRPVFNSLRRVVSLAR